MRNATHLLLAGLGLLPAGRWLAPAWRLAWHGSTWRQIADRAAPAAGDPATSQ